MPCRSDYMEPNEREKESKLVAELLAYVLRAIKMPVPKCVTDASDYGYGDASRLDYFTDMLCSTLKDVPEELLEKMMYDGHNSKARKLTDWWERHQLVDANREVEEKQSLISKAISKLTEEELEAIKAFFQESKNGQV